MLFVVFWPMLMTTSFAVLLEKHIYFAVGVLLITFYYLQMVVIFVDRLVIHFTVLSCVASAGAFLDVTLSPLPFLLLHPQTNLFVLWST